MGSYGILCTHTHIYIYIRVCVRTCSKCFGLRQATTGVESELGRCFVETWDRLDQIGTVSGQCQVSDLGLDLRYGTGAGNQSPVRCQTLQLAKGSESQRCRCSGGVLSFKASGLHGVACYFNLLHEIQRNKHETSKEKHSRIKQRSSGPSRTPWKSDPKTWIGHLRQEFHFGPKGALQDLQRWPSANVCREVQPCGSGRARWDVGNRSSNQRTSKSTRTHTLRPMASHTMISDIVLAMKWKERGASDSSNLFNEFSVCVCE